MPEALALLELRSLARGLRSLDALVKKAPVEVLEANLIEPGRFLILIAGGVAEVEVSLEAALATADDDIVDQMLLADAHPELLAGLLLASRFTLGDMLYSRASLFTSDFTAGSFFEANRPPTRMHWWWSHGIPTLALDLPTLRDAARRAGYPTSMVALRGHRELEGALRSLACAHVRECLRQAALSAAAVSSPQASARELANAVCRLRHSARAATSHDT